MSKYYYAVTTNRAEHEQSRCQCRKRGAEMKQYIHFMLSDYETVAVYDLIKQEIDGAYIALGGNHNYTGYFIPVEQEEEAHSVFNRVRWLQYEVAEELVTIPAKRSK